MPVGIKRRELRSAKSEKEKDDVFLKKVMNWNENESAKVFRGLKRSNLKTS
jgi:hypothetical protein